MTYFEGYFSGYFAVAGSAGAGGSSNWILATGTWIDTDKVWVDEDVWVDGDVGAFSTGFSSGWD